MARDRSRNATSPSEWHAMYVCDKDVIGSPLTVVAYVAGGLNPHTVQMMLVRLCADAVLARDIWENIVRVNLSDPMMHLYPWVIVDDQIIVGRQPAGETARNRVAGKSTSLKTAYNIAVTAAPGGDSSSKAKRLAARRLSSATHLAPASPTIDMSYTKSDICMGPIQINFMDSLLGPTMPRYQVNVSDIFLCGSVLHRGIVPNLSFTSTYGLQSDLVGGVSIESSFFNSKVGAHEPVIEPYTIQLAAIKHPDGQFVAFDVNDRGPLQCNISTAFLQAMATIVLSLDHFECNMKDPDETVNMFALGVFPFNHIIGNSLCTNHQR